MLTEVSAAVMLESPPGRRQPRLRRGDKRKPRVLLAYNKKRKLWELPGGHVEDDESPARALMRELEEEIGVRSGDYTFVGHPADAATEEPKPFDRNIDATRRGYIGMRYYIVRLKPGVVPRPEHGRDYDEVKWVSIKAAARWHVSGFTRDTLRKLDETYGHYMGRP